MADSPPALEDEREVELSSIAAIFPEIILDPQDPFSASIDLPVVPSYPLPVVFPESLESVTLSVDAGAEPATETHYLSHLPDLRLEITLPEGYPASSAPHFRISTSPQWLPGAILEQLKIDGQRLWEDLGHDQVVFAYIDHLQQAAEDTFGVLGESEYLQVSPDHKIVASVLVSPGTLDGGGICTNCCGQIRRRVQFVIGCSTVVMYSVVNVCKISIIMP
jgi:E3 ubiquitin-protein ligase RNF14